MPADPMARGRLWRRESHDAPWHQQVMYPLVPIKLALVNERESIR